MGDRRRLITGHPERARRPGRDTWDLAWCWPCKRDHPLEPVHEQAECPRRSEDEEDVDD